MAVFFAPPLDVEQGRSLLAPQLLEQLMLAESLAGSCLLRLHLYFVFERFAFMLLFDSDSRHTTPFLRAGLCRLI